MSDQGFPPPPPPPPGGGIPPPPPPPGGYAQPAQQTIQGASFWQRLGAFIIDGLVVGVPLFIVQSIVLAQAPTELAPCTVGGEFGICEQYTGTGWLVFGLMWLAGVAVQLWYWGTLEGRRGQTLGKSALSIRTVDMETGEPIGVGRAIGRFFSRLLFVLLFVFPTVLDHLWMLWDDDDQTLHDKMVRSRVVRA